MKQQMNLDPNKYANDLVAKMFLKELEELDKPNEEHDEFDDIVDNLTAGDRIALEGDPQESRKSRAMGNVVTKLNEKSKVIISLRRLDAKDWFKNKEA